MRTNKHNLSVMRSLLLGQALAATILCASVHGQTPQPSAQPPSTNPYSQHASGSRRAELHYSLDWGVDGLSVKLTESGELIRFSYHVLDPAKAAPLNDAKLDPYLIDERANVKLAIPTMEKVGQLRNKNTPEAGKSYWMAFSNKGGLVKKGDLVTVVVGNFHATGLVVQ